MTFFLLISLLFALGNSLKANSSNPPSGYHGESLNCTFCHTGNSVNSGDGGISLGGLPSSYVPGQTYNLALTVSGTNSRGYGFQLSPKINGNLVGQLTAVSNDMGIESNSAEHRGPSLTGTWNFEWTAPSTDEGTVTFYASGLATGGNSGNDGDYVYTLSKSLSADSFPYASMDWNASTNGVIFSSPALASDGTIYVGSNDNKLYAINPDGTTKWSFTTGNWVDSTPAVGPDGVIYVGSWDNKVYAIDPGSGTKIWEYETNSNVIASPAIGADGKIYVGSKDSIFYAFESNGSVAWEYFVGQPITASAALGQDGTIYFGDENGSFHALNSDGSSKWTYQVDNVADSNNSILSSAALDLSGNIYFGSGNGYCYSISDNETNASLNWKFLTGDRVDASPVLGLNEEVIFVSRDGYMRSLSTLSGGLNWDAFVGDVFYSSPVVDENGRTYVIGYTGGGQNHLFAFDANGTKAWDTNDTNCPFEIEGIVDSSLALSESGSLYYGCYDQRLYSMNIGAGPATSDWPMFQRSPQRDGAWPSYQLDISISPSGVATALGAGIYNEGSTATISLDNILDGYTFDGWTQGASGNSNPLSIVINSNTSVTANFVLNQYQLTVNSAAGGSASSSGTFNHGANATIEATPSPGYYFSGWSGQGIENVNAATTTVSMSENRTVTPSFTPLTYSISATVVPSNAGEVSGAGNYQFGDNATLAATATSSGYSFLSWSGDINSSQNPLTVSIDSNLSLNVNFILNSYTLSVASVGDGTTTGSGTYSHGDLVNISATPATGYSFAGWTGSGVTDTNASSTTVSITANTSVSALFEPNSYTLSLSAGTGGTVSGAGTYLYGSVAEIEATPHTGYSFDSWYGATVADENALQTSVTINQNTSLSALFQINEYTLSASSPLGGSITGAGQYSYGTTVTVNAIPENNYIFSHWVGENLEDLNASSTTILMNQNQEIEAVFVEKPPEQKSLLVTSSPNNAGTTSGSGAYPVGEVVNLSATPLDGYEFSYWEGQNILDTNSSLTTALIANDQNITAHFQALTYQINITSNNGGTVEGTGQYTRGSTIAISATPDNGYRFTGWSGADLPNPLLDSFSLEVTQDLNLTAAFSIQEYMVTVSQNIQGGTVSGEGIYPHGTTVSLSAAPFNGYQFVYWSQAGNAVSADKSMNLVIESDAEITANFEKLVITEIEGVEPLGDEWYGSNWLGYFYTTGTDWSYHVDLGWLYIIPNDDASLWAWSPRLDWLWLSPTEFLENFAWSKDDNNWIFFSFEATGGAQIYHYRNDSWSSFNPNEPISLEDSIF